MCKFTGLGKVVVSIACFLAYLAAIMIVQVKQKTILRTRGCSKVLLLVPLLLFVFSIGNGVYKLVTASESDMLCMDELETKLVALRIAEILNPMIRLVIVVVFMVRIIQVSLIIVCQSQEEEDQARRKIQLLKVVISLYMMVYFSVLTVVQLSNQAEWFTSWILVADYLMSFALHFFISLIAFRSCNRMKTIEALLR